MNDRQQLLAIEAVAAGRFDEATRIVAGLQQERPMLVERGRCRYCGCSESRPCAIVVNLAFEFEPPVVRCGWANQDATVCTNAACIERWRREEPKLVGFDAPPKALVS